VKAPPIVRWARAASVASITVFLSGCLAGPVVVDTPTRPRTATLPPLRPPPPAPPPPPPSVLEAPGGGRIAVKPGRAGHVVAAPHGDSDLHTAEIATEVAERSGFSLVIATDFWTDPRTVAGPRRRHHVNRPLEGVPGRPASEEVATPAARDTYLTYERRVQEAAQGPLLFYAEIHGNGRLESAARVEIATIGVDADLAVRFRTLFELIRDAHLRGRPGVPRLEIVVDPADTIYFLASSAKRDGILRRAQRGVHVELPMAARTAGRDAYAAILADFFAQAAALPSWR
jgi:hypothetical protein